MPLPLVSVVVPTRDRAALLAQTLASVLAQRDVALEAIVVDDGSRDATPDVLARFGDARVTVVRHARSLGVSAARNAGIAVARGAWIAFLDDDDLWAPDKLAHQLAAAERAGRVWACSGSVSFVSDDDGPRVTAGAPPPDADAIVAALPYRNRVPAGASNVLVRAGALRTVGGFDPALRHMADWELWVRLARLGPPAVVREPDVAYRLHASNASADSEAIAAEVAHIEARSADLRGWRSVDRAFAHRWAAWNLARAGRRAAAVRAYVRAAAAGDLLSIARAVVVAAAPWGARRPLARLGYHAGWIARAEAWLRDYR